MGLPRSADLKKEKFKLSHYWETIMRISSVRIKNFRGYLESTPMSVSAFTSIVGRNDVGKSTLLEALDIYFNGGKPDADDAHIRARGQPTKISCLFEDLPAEVVLDARAPTTLADEYLLNADGDLEIVKEYDLGASRITAKVFARANHPMAEGAADLLQLNNTKLKTRAGELGVDLERVDQRVNSQIRNAIWRHIGDLTLGDCLIPLNDEDAKKVWALLQKDMPAFALFQADRPSRDDDSEVTSPFDAAIKDAVKGLEPQFDQIKVEVKQKVEEVARRTLAKLREMDATLADDLRTVFKTEPKWAGFKLSLTDHDDIPINKRGSGVRRLILLNFFRAEAERRQLAANSPGIIYAVEEPESSQHPINQKMLINALLELSNADNTQVLITTHVPGIAALVPPESIRYVHHDNNRHPRVIENDEDVLRLVADQLGVLPDKRVRLLLYVEGPNDVSFLEKISSLTDDIDLGTDPRVAFVLSGGGNLKHWVNRRYLQGLGIPEIHIYDRDSDGGYQRHVDIVNGRGNDDWATLTAKCEIENYLHPDAIRDSLGVTVTFGDDDDVPMIVARAIHEASESSRQWNEVDDEDRAKKASKAKSRLCAAAVAQMTSEQLGERDPGGEVSGWLARIAAAVG